MDKTRYHLFVCVSYRTGGEPKGVCHRKGAVDLLAYLEYAAFTSFAGEVTTELCLQQPNCPCFWAFVPLAYV